MKEVTKLLINDFKIRQLNYDFMGYSLQRGDIYTFHHFLIANRENGPYAYWNGVILCGKTSHPYLHLIESKDEERFYDITSEFLDMKNKVKELSLSDKVQFLGIRRDVHTILMSFDYVVIPSLYEGFPVTAIEAQAIGVPCLISDSVTKDVVINNNVKMLSLRESADVWADQIYKNKKVQRNSNKEGLIKKGFDIATTTDYLLEIYKE